MNKIFGNKDRLLLLLKSNNVMYILVVFNQTKNKGGYWI